MIRRRGARRVAAAIAPMALAVLVGGAGAADGVGPPRITAPPRPTPSPTSPQGETRERPAPILSNAGRAGATAGGTTLTEQLIVCPDGWRVDRVLADVGFDDPDLPFPSRTEGWALTSATADAAATTTGTFGPDGYATLPVAQIGGPITSAVLSFTYRGVWDAADRGAMVGGVSVNEQSILLRGSAAWTPVKYAVATDTGPLSVSFDFYEGTAPTSMQVDDVQVSTCVRNPNAGTKGDWTGEGAVDLLATTTTGSLLLYEGRGDGRVSSSRSVGAGWADFTWIGSPGDVSGDRRSDLLARGPDLGTVYLYQGWGNGRVERMGSGGSTAGQYTAIATPGDLDGDGALELLLRAADGSLVRATLIPSGGLRRTAVIGSGWNSVRLITGVGDVNGDRRGDLVAVRTSDQCLYLYRASVAGGLGAAVRIGCGWSGVNLLTSPGDMDGNGVPDLVARRADGTLWRYPLNPGGTSSRAGIRIGSGWGGMTQIL